MYKFENANATIEYYMPSSNICSIYELDENFEKKLRYGIRTTKIFIRTA